MNLAIADLIASHTWQKAYFTTYALSLSFFEAVILDALVRGNSGGALILADVNGVRASLSERGAQRVGKDYDIEPVAVDGGVFHPKISVLLSTTECHVLVGSGNLTFGGWGANCEILEHLHPSFAADAILDTADFFDALAGLKRARHASRPQCAALAQDLRAAVSGRPRTGHIRLLHSLSGAIADQIVTFADDLGGATRLLAAAPYWDNGAAIDSLSEKLGVKEVFLHSHEYGTVALSGVVANWPRRARVQVNAVRLDVLRKDNRRLHAKAFEIVCRRGRVLISGSANGSSAALGPDSNVEACVVRIFRNSITGWTFKPGAPIPLAVAPTETDAEGVSEVGILRGVLDGDQLTVDVLTPRMTGDVSVFQITSLGAQQIGRGMLDKDGGFRIISARLERESWRRGRLVIRVEDASGHQAEGFVSIAGFTDVVRRAGAVARSLFALVNGSEMPADIAAILEWFQENPEHLTRGRFGSPSSAGSRDDDDYDTLIPVTSLVVHRTRDGIDDEDGIDGSQTKWTRFFDRIVASFREKRGPIDRGDGGRSSDVTSDGVDQDDDEPIDQEAEEENQDVQRAFLAFQKLLARLTTSSRTSRHVTTAFYLTEFMCDRLRPDADLAGHWFKQIIRACGAVGVPDEHRDDVVAAILRFAAANPNIEQYRWARETVLALQGDLAGQLPTSDRATGFAAVWPAKESPEKSWEEIRRVRTLNEQRNALRDAVRSGTTSPDYPDIASTAPEVWATLQHAIATGESQQLVRWLSADSECCPECEMNLPETERQKLLQTGIARAKNCCGAVLVRVG